MSLDETLDRMRAFAAELEQFDDALQQSRIALENRHAEAAVAWQDAFAREYAEAWAPLHAGLECWCLREGPEYRHFVTEKLRALSQYLDGER
ncbi:MAG: hypothetical protein H7099_19140 [Gemmatimonadaceae bacterium]|nr:hypothetical protein [Gemmatimonadaceae bacterium]